RFIIKESQASVCLRGGKAERTNNSRNLRNLDAESGRTELLDVFRSPGGHLRQERTHRAKPLPACNARILSSFNLAKIVANRPVNRVAQREMKNIIGCSASRHTPEVRGRLASQRTACAGNRLICLCRCQSRHCYPQECTD